MSVGVWSKESGILVFHSALPFVLRDEKGEAVSLGPKDRLLIHTIWIQGIPNASRYELILVLGEHRFLSHIVPGESPDPTSPRPHPKSFWFATGAVFICPEGVAPQLLPQSLGATDPPKGETDGFGSDGGGGSGAAQVVYGLIGRVIRNP